MIHRKGHRPNFKKCVSFDLEIPFLGTFYTETLIHTHRDLCTRILDAVVLETNVQRP